MHHGTKSGKTAKRIAKARFNIGGKKYSGKKLLSMFEDGHVKHGIGPNGEHVNSPAYMRIGNHIVTLGKAGTLAFGINVMPIADKAVLAAHAAADPAFKGATIRS